MAWYQNGKVLKHSTTKHAFWSEDYGPSDEVPVSGIYKCKGCSKEITSNYGDKFPPQNRHQHTAEQGDVVWRLIVRTDTQGANGWK